MWIHSTQTSQMGFQLTAFINSTYLQLICSIQMILIACSLWTNEIHAKVVRHLISDPQIRCLSWELKWYHKCSNCKCSFIVLNLCLQFSFMLWWVVTRCHSDTPSFRNAAIPKRRFSNMPMSHHSDKTFHKEMCVTQQVTPFFKACR